MSIRTLTWVYAALMAVSFGCSRQPDAKVAHGEKDNLFEKTLLTSQVYSLSAPEGEPKPLLTQIKTDGTDTVKFHVSKSYLTLLSVDGSKEEPIVQWAITEHYDLAKEKDKEGKESQFYIRNTTNRPKWEERDFVEVNPADPLYVKAEPDTLVNLYPVSQLKDAVMEYESGNIPGLAAPTTLKLTSLYNLKQGDKVKFTLTQHFFSVFRVEDDGNMTILAQTPIDYFDLTQQKVAVGDKSYELGSTLVRDSTENPWDRRSWVLINAEKTVVAEPTPALYHNLFKRSDLEGKSFVWGKDTIPVLSSNQAAMLEIESNSYSSAKAGDTITVNVSRDYLSFYNAGKLIAQYVARGFYDIKPMQRADGTVTTTLARNSIDRVWTEREFISVDPFDPAVVTPSQTIVNASERMLTVDKVNDCYTVSDLPLDAVKRAVISAGAEEDLEVCLQAAQSILSIYSMKTGDKVLLMTMSILNWIDIDFQVTDEGETTRTLVPRDHGNAWYDRAYVVLDISNPKPVENYVDPNIISKKALEGEFIYQATVIDSHSENGVLFDGASLQSGDRLVFSLGQDTVTAYKLNEQLNNSGAKSPFLRFSAKHYDIGRELNGYNDETNVINELVNKPWQERKFIQVDFGSNQIPGYWNDLLGLEKLIFNTVITAKTLRSSEVKVEDGYITYDTEEVLTPNYLAGNIGSEELFLEPVAVKIRHVFVRLDKRNYAAKEYNEFDFNRFGYFRTTNFGIDPDLGKTDDTLKHYINRHDISNGKHIDFYLSAGYPEKFKDEAQAVVDSWNMAFKQATGREGVVRLHDNSGQDFADPRVNMIVWIPTRSSASPLGYGPSTTDPMTGEILSSKSFIYGDAVRSVRKASGDIFDLVSGRKSALDFEAEGTAAGPFISGEREGGLARLASKLPTSKAELEILKQSAPIASASGISGAFKKLERSVSPLAEQLMSRESAKNLHKATPSLIDVTSKQFRDENNNLTGFGGCSYESDYHVQSARRFIEANIDMDRDQLLEEIESKIVYSTLLHEVGHNLGLRHNFHGSFDEQSFHNEYFEINARIKAGERAGEIGDNAFNYRTSSVMDYNDTFEGLQLKAGLYDIAAIKFGYGEILERVVGVNENGSLVTEDIAQADVLAIMEQIRLQNPTATRAQIEAFTSQELGIRKYKFCTDGHVNDDPTCNRFDRGVTVAEMTQSWLEDYDQTYSLRAFRRGRREFSGDSSWIISRYILPIRQIYDEYIYKLIYGGFSAEGAESQDDYITGIRNGLAFYDKVLNSVEPGDYVLNTETGEFAAGAATAEGDKQLLVDVEYGKYLVAQASTTGESERVLNRGVELDKLAVFMALSMRGYPAQKYQKASLTLNYFDLLKEYTFEIFSDFIKDTRTTEVVGFKPEGSDVYYAVDFDPNMVPDGNDMFVKGKIKPSSNTATQLYALLFAILDYNNAGDLTFKDYIDFRRAGIDDMGLAADVPLAKFRSANGLHTYVVPQTRDGLSISFSVAKEAEAASMQLEELIVLLAQRPDDQALKAAIVESFAAAWLLVRGSEIPADLLEDLYADLGGYLPAIDSTMQGWVSQTTDADVLAQLTELQAKISDGALAYEAIAEDVETMQNQVDDLTRDVTRYESQLIQMRDFYEIFN